MKISSVKQVHLWRPLETEMAGGQSHLAIEEKKNKRKVKKCEIEGCDFFFKTTRGLRKYCPTHSEEARRAQTLRKGYSYAYTLLQKRR